VYFCGRLCKCTSRTRILLMNSSRLRAPGSDVSLDSAPGMLPLHSSALQRPPLPLSLSLGRSPDSHAREKSLLAHKYAHPVHQSCMHAECTSLHRTAQHRTARQTAPRNALLHTINSLPCSHRACAFSDRCNGCAAGRLHALRCMWQSEAWRARHVRDFCAVL